MFLFVLKNYLSNLLLCLQLQCPRHWEGGRNCIYPSRAPGNHVSSQFTEVKVSNWKFVDEKCTHSCFCYLCSTLPAINNTLIFHLLPPLRCKRSVLVIIILVCLHVQKSNTACTMYAYYVPLLIFYLSTIVRKFKNI